MTEQDISACSNIHVLVNSMARNIELNMLMRDFMYAPHVLERDGLIVGYSCGFTYLFFFFLM